jgi:hypothetical protein
MIKEGNTPPRLSEIPPSISTAVLIARGRRLQRETRALGEKLYEAVAQCRLLRAMAREERRQFRLWAQAQSARGGSLDGVSCREGCPGFVARAPGDETG